MSFSTAIAIVVLADIALVSLLAFVMSRAGRLSPHAETAPEPAKHPTHPATATRPARETPHASSRPVPVR